MISKNKLIYLLDLLKMVISTYHEQDLPNLVYKYGYDGVRCKCYKHNDKIVLAIKGTTLEILGYKFGTSSENDKKMVNIMFNMCSSPLCTYTKKVEFDKLQYLTHLRYIVDSMRVLYPGCDIILTGHSLGGALASLLSCVYGYKCVAFSSPGEKYISEVLDLCSEHSNVEHYGMCNDYLYLGTCNEMCSVLGYTLNTTLHNGKVYCVSTASDTKSVLYHRSSTLLNVLLQMLGSY